MSEQAWEQRAVERLPRTPNNYLAALQHDLSEQFRARYSFKCLIRTAFDIIEATVEERPATCPLLFDDRFDLQE